MAQTRFAGADESASPLPADHPPGAPWRDALACGGAGPELLTVAVGAYVMGGGELDPMRTPNEAPRTKVTFSAPFGLGRTSVTFEAYDAFAHAVGAPQPDDMGWGRGAMPVINVSWRDAQRYCAWLSDQTGAVYRLPLEAEWEYACRAGGARAFSTGDDITIAEANYDGGEAEGGSLGRTATVGSYPPNPWGFLDMHGNVAEWCADAWSETYMAIDPLTLREIDPEDPAATVVVRGGGWSTKKRFVRSADRYHYGPDNSFEMVGFRVLRVL